MLFTFSTEVRFTIVRRVPPSSSPPSALFAQHLPPPKPAPPSPPASFTTRSRNWLHQRGLLLESFGNPFAWMTGQRDETENGSTSGSSNTTLVEKGKADISSPAPPASASAAHVWFCIMYQLYHPNLSDARDVSFLSGIILSCLCLSRS